MKSAVDTAMNAASETTTDPRAARSEVSSTSTKRASSVEAASASVEATSTAVEAAAPAVATAALCKRSLRRT
jgi:hypothetical protein